jgi:hypothetical protein
MNALLIAGIVIFAVWFERRRRAGAPRRYRRRDDDALSHAFITPSSPKPRL